MPEKRVLEFLQDLKSKSFFKAYKTASFLISFFIVFNRLNVVLQLDKWDYPDFCRLCVCVIIYKRSFEPFMYLDQRNPLPGNYRIHLLLPY